MKIEKNRLPSILIHCQYVYGIGHLVRATELAHGLSAQFKVYLVNGGEKVPNFNIPDEVNYIQLPAIYKNETANHLTPVNSSHSITECFQLRETIITELIETIKPDIVITEHFPFGLLFEQEALNLITKVKKIKKNARIISSVRDVIEASQGSDRDPYVCHLLNKWYDMVLVHGDENIIPFTSSFPISSYIKIPVYLTGYIVRNIKQSIKQSKLPILLVSIGGGRMGEELLEAVLNNHQQILKKWQHQLILFTGAFQKDLSELFILNKKRNFSSVKVYDFDKKLYEQILSQAALIICLGGYNSLIEAVSMRKPVLVYKRKFHGKNKEQDLRVTLFQRLGFIHVISSDDFDKETLTNLILDVALDFQFKPKYINLNGVEKSVELISNIFYRK